jgi:hypothetical protein
MGFRIFVLLPALYISCTNHRAVPPHIMSSTVNAEDSLKKPYKEFLNEVDSSRKVLKGSLSRAVDSMKPVVLRKAGSYLVQLLANEFFQYWQGTPWDFNGSSEEPGKGTIACGYFVTTLLRDAGYPLNRVRLAICPSMTMMKALTSAKDVKNLSAMSYSEFCSNIKKAGENIYIAGLDYHTGFIVNDGTDQWFLHSNYINKKGVVKERLETSAALRSSETRYITCLSRNEKFLSSWLLK